MSRRRLEVSLALWRRRHRWNERKRAKARERGNHDAAYRYGKRLGECVRMIERRKKQLQDLKPLRERAYEQAVRSIGVMEQGGNNRGREVEKLIAKGGGQAGDPWCGWFMAAVYRLAGSKTVDWRWGAVRLLYPLTGIRRVSNPERGDLVRFTFDHVGMFVADHGNEIETIEGNTGASGAVSDSKTGGDGVYRKRRSKNLVNDYLRVTR